MYLVTERRFLLISMAGITLSPTLLEILFQQVTGSCIKMQVLISSGKMEAIISLNIIGSLISAVIRTGIIMYILPIGILPHKPFTSKFLRPRVCGVFN